MTDEGKRGKGYATSYGTLENCGQRQTPLIQEYCTEQCVGDGEINECLGGEGASTPEYGILNVYSTSSSTQGEASDDNISTDDMAVEETEMSYSNSSVEEFVFFRKESSRTVLQVKLGDIPEECAKEVADTVAQDNSNRLTVSDILIVEYSNPHTSVREFGCKLNNNIPTCDFSSDSDDRLMQCFPNHSFAPEDLKPSLNTCVDETDYLGNEFPSISTVEGTETQIHQAISCDCSVVEGTCNNQESIVTNDVPTARINVYNNSDPLGGCSGIFVKVNGEDRNRSAFCTVAHCVNPEWTNVTHFDIFPHSCPQNNDRPLRLSTSGFEGFGPHFGDSRPYIDSPMCIFFDENIEEEIRTTKLNSCISYANFDTTAIPDITEGYELFYHTQESVTINGSVTGKIRPWVIEEGVERQSDEYIPYVHFLMNGDTCIGDSGGGFYNFNGQLAGLHMGNFIDGRIGAKDYGGLSCDLDGLLSPLANPNVLPEVSNIDTSVPEYLAYKERFPIRIKYYETTDGLSNSDQVIKSEKFTPDSIFPLVQAQEINPSPQPLDARYSTEDLPSGQYELSNGDTLELKSPAKVITFSDMNGNGKRDPGEPVVTDPELTFVKKADGFNYNLNRGWNAINMPFTKDSNNFYKASEIMAIASDQGVDMSIIKKWDGKWVEYAVDDELAYGEDFNVIPNEGYFVNVQTSGDFHLWGSRSESSSFPIQLNNGWNLVGVSEVQNATNNGTESSRSSSGKELYANDSFNDGIEALEFIKVVNSEFGANSINNITRWDNGVYRSVNQTESKNFGLDFAIKANEAYFVRSDKKGVFVP